MDTEKLWFASWFDTPYYHILYKNRDDSEAELFIRNLKDKLSLTTEHVLDLACGKGRHSKYMYELGLSVLGVDLSEQSISIAKSYTKDKLNFLVHDMREVLPNHKFDVIFNLFTSFGYFEDDKENHVVLQSVHHMLNDKGRLVIDFMNSEKIIKELVSNEVKIVDGITFEIKREYDGRFIRKYIDFEDKGNRFSFMEKVRAFKYEDFHELLIKNGFTILHSLGDFDLNPFDSTISERLILIAQKR